MQASAVTYDGPADVTPSPDFRVWVGGQDVFVHRCEVASYAIFSFEGQVTVEIEPAFEFQKVTVRPLSRGIEASASGERLTFVLEEPAQLSVEFDGDIGRPLFVFACPPETDPPRADDPAVRYFAGGRVHTPGLMELADAETIYIEGGAVVRGAVVAENAENIAVRGRGVLDGSVWQEGDQKKRVHMLRFINCRNVTVEGITVASSPCWTVVPVGCADVTVTGVKVMTAGVGGDGVDLVGTCDALVSDCFLRCADDCVALKASNYRHECGGNDVEHVQVRGCVLWNARPGNALEIGYETRCDRIRDIVFRDCDVIRVEHEGYQSGATLSIHNGDRAIVSDVRYEDIRVEDSREKLIDLKVLLARYSRDEERGQIRDVHFRDVRVVDGPFPVSIIRGYDGDHIITDVTIENLVVHGRPVRSANAARMVVELARGVRFTGGS